MRSRRPTEALAVKRSGGNQHRSMWQSAEIVSYGIARERSSPALARQAAALSPGLTSSAGSRGEHAEAGGVGEVLEVRVPRDQLDVVVETRLCDQRVSEARLPAAAKDSRPKEAGPLPIAVQHVEHGEPREQSSRTR